MTIDFKDLPAYHWMTDDAHEAGIEEGLAKGLIQGHQEGLQEGMAALRLAIIGIVEQDFPRLRKLAQKQLALIQHSAPLIKLVAHLHKAHNSDEVKRYLTEALEESLDLD